METGTGAKLWVKTMGGLKEKGIIGGQICDKALVEKGTNLEGEVISVGEGPSLRRIRKGG